MVVVQLPQRHNLAKRDIYPVYNFITPNPSTYASNNLKLKGEAGFAEDQIQYSSFAT